MDEETIHVVKMIGLQVQLMDTVLLAVINGLHAQSRMLAAKLSTLSDSERQVFLDAISKNETQTESLEASSQQFQAAFESWLRRQ